jgi:hypothetical protein
MPNETMKQCVERHAQEARALQLHRELLHELLAGEASARRRCGGAYSQQKEGARYKLLLWAKEHAEQGSFQFYCPPSWPSVAAAQRAGGGWITSTDLVRNAAVRVDARRCQVHPPNSEWQ